ncbi:hypothetical protein F66182_5124 [Fusarium sp. NRRL 66182]|nr:hypothetical protein F66182_5124 [Fusarium sp. NRRL 66182]
MGSQQLSPAEGTRTISEAQPSGTPSMKILFLCTAHNSLSQQLYLTLSQCHSVTVEYALSDAAMIEAAILAKPDLIICPFLTSRVPSRIFTQYLTLIIHPGPPGDAGPSALDWVLMGDDGTVQESDKLLDSQAWSRTGRSHWGVTVLQAVAEMDAGPVWAFEQFKIDIDAPGTTKSTLYRGRTTQAAITATVTALNRIAAAANGYSDPSVASALSKLSLLQTPDVCGISVHLLPSPMYRTMSVTQRKPFLGGLTRRRPLLKAADRRFDIHHESARSISRKIRSADSQPGCLTTSFGGVSLYIYGGTIESGRDANCQLEPGSIVGCRDGAVCIATCDGQGIWITHIRRMKRKVDIMLWPKVPAASGLLDLGLINQATLCSPGSLRSLTGWSKAAHPTHQDTWVDFASSIAFVYFEFYNGAMDTTQCSRLIEALDFVACQDSLHAVVLMGGESYFSNGIALNVIEASSDPSGESWRNINRIDDVVQMLLDVFPRKSITTIAAMRGNCAAGGVAMAAACDVVIAGSESVLSPAYRALGLHGSEYHSLSYAGRCGSEKANQILRNMLPMTAYQARDIGLVDHVLPGSGPILDIRVRYHVRGMTFMPYSPGRWKSQVDVSPSGLASARAQELSEMAKDFWSARSERYTSRRRDFVRKVKPTHTPLRFATHRRQEGEVDEEEADSFDDVAVYEEKTLQRVIGERLSKMDGEFLSRRQDHDGYPIAPDLGHAKRGTPQGKDILFSCYFDVDTLCT